MKRSSDVALYFIFSVLFMLMCMLGGCFFVTLMQDRGLTFEGIITLIRGLF